MQIKVTQKKLLTALNNVLNTISSKPQLPILNCLLLKVEKDQINLFSTDLNIGVKTKIDGEIIEIGQAAIPAKFFIETVKSLNSGNLIISLDKQTLLIKSDKSKTSIQCQEDKDFPEFIIPTTLKKEISLEKMSIIEKYVSFSTSLDQARPILTTLLFRQNKNNWQIVGTDGFRLSLLKLEREERSQQKDFLIANKAFLEIARVSSQQSIKNVCFEVFDELKQAFFKVGDTIFFIRLIEGAYPPFEKIVPLDFETEVSFDGEEFESILKQAVVFAKEVSNIITLDFNEEKMKIMASASSKGSYEGEIKISLSKGTGGKISFNARYLLDFIKNVKPERVWLKMNDGLKPVMFKEEGNDFFEYVVMPFRLNS